MPGFWQNLQIVENGPRHASSLRQRRLESGLTQVQLAERAGVSRQLVAAVETGQNAPAVDAALRLARALGTSVESLFSTAPDAVVPALGEPVREGRPLRVGRVGDQLVAAELPDHGAAGAAWGKPDGILAGGRLRLCEGATPAGLVLAGCDPALGVAEAMLQGLGSRSLSALPAATGSALEALDAGGIHAAVVHGPEPGLPRPPVPVIRLHLARWRVGVATAPRRGPEDLDSLLGARVPVVQRQASASSQQAFARALERAGYQHPPVGRQASGHIEAARLGAILDAAAVTTESAARAFDLRFLPLEEHTVQIWVAERWADHPALAALGEILASAAFIDRVSQFGGYELAGCGSRV